MDFQDAAKIALWSWAAAHVATCFWRAWSGEVELRSEARLLLDRVCGEGISLGSALIRCDEARAIVAAGPLPLIAFEAAGRRLMLDTLAAARRELAALARTLGLIGAVFSAMFLVARHFAVRAGVWNQCIKESSLSEMKRAKHASFINMGSQIIEPVF